MNLCTKNHIQIVYCGGPCPLCAALEDSRRVIEARKVLHLLRDIEAPAEAATRAYNAIYDALK